MDIHGAWVDTFNKFATGDAAAIFAKYPRFWNDAVRGSEFHGNVFPILNSSAYDAAAMLAYYRGEANSKDAVRIFQAFTRETIDRHGYGPDVSKYIAIWYFLIVLLSEYELKHGIQETTDVLGMFKCYINTGEIDYAHDWTD
ncbi:hypothetical protein EVB84_013 [Rhizobium phage RHph_Y48]|uniref:Uncharacterized protein n=1 Tax=Rhizobium phage RHph_Y1_20 TaxID=2509571 RepID=A0A7S5UT62_9CAUD|nr:hypothetical protein EVB57_012 [Rhizobium phage RHph_Y1_20]QIG69957.1 hypothetical protein EVB84_013 [Rhizobium phage RHph_Y48]QIG70009.1 hypothetical protein EVB85_013 [Rhizobium phage RHph_Y86]QIG70061.1 hypothetical protein EVB86_013 [Rhizobium phage RHph_Y2_7]